MKALPSPTDETLIPTSPSVAQSIQRVLDQLDRYELSARSSLRRTRETRLRRRAVFGRTPECADLLADETFENTTSVVSPWHAGSVVAWQYLAPDATPAGCP
jgi:hypothetical protein